MADRRLAKPTHNGMVKGTLAVAVVILILLLGFMIPSLYQTTNINAWVHEMNPIPPEQICYHNCQDSCKKYPSAASLVEPGYSHGSHHHHHGPPTISYESCFEKCTGSGPNPIEVNFKCANEGYSIPTAIRFGRARGDNPQAPQRMFVASQDGIVRMSSQNSRKSGTQKVILNLSSDIGGTINTNLAISQGGLVGFELHPRFSRNGKFFVMYSVPREDGTVANTPNCSTNGGYGSSGSSDNRRNFGQDRAYVADNYNDLLIIEMWFLHSARYEAQFLSTIIVTKHFFNTHYGWDTLFFEENGKLLAYIPDGGCHYDQFGVAQNRDFILGKVIYIDVDHNSTITPLWDDDDDDDTPPPLPPYIGLSNCTTPVALWSELESACPYNYMVYGIYSSGVMNGGHMSMDRHNGVLNHYLSSDTTNAQVGIYRFEYESNFGWVTWDAQVCTCILGDYFMDPVCDFNQTIAQCLADMTSITGAFTKPLVALNYPVDQVISNIGGHVYRGNELPCSLRGRYIWGDMIKWNVADNEAATRFRLWTTNQASSQVNQATAHEKLRLGEGLKDEENYLYSFGYDRETNRMYVGVSPSAKSIVDDVASTEGKVYQLTFWND